MAITDPDARNFLAGLEPAAPRAFGDVRVIRDGARRAAAPDPGGYRVHSRDLRLPGPEHLPARIYRPTEGEPAATVLYLHGGGWALGDLEINDHVCRYLTERSGLALISLDYPLAPEHPYPAALDTATELASAVAAGGFEKLPAPLVLAGLSAGAALAAGVVLRGLADRAPRAHSLVMLSPVTDSDLDRPSYHEHAQAPLLSAEDMRWFWSMYDPRESARTEPEAAVLRGSFAGLPSATVVVSEVDPLRDEGVAFGAATSRAGVATETILVPGVPHAFMAVPTIRSGRAALDRTAARLAEQFGGTPPGR